MPRPWTTARADPAFWSPNLGRLVTRSGDVRPWIRYAQAVKPTSAVSLTPGRRRRNRVFGEVESGSSGHDDLAAHPAADAVRERRVNRAAELERAGVVEGEARPLARVDRRVLRPVPAVGGDRM